MLSESMCDNCVAPGACCKRLWLNGGRVRDGSEFEKQASDIGEPMSFERAEHEAMRRGFPMFRPAHQMDDGRWQWWCTALQRDGRCGIYDSRPQLCRSYRPGQDGLCVHYWPDPDPISHLAADVAALEGARA